MKPSLLFKSLLFKAKAPPNLNKYIGKTVNIPTFMNIDGKRIKVLDEKVTIDHIVGNKVTPQFYEINGKYLIGMLRFYAQMTGAKDLTEDQFHAFETMDIKAEKMTDKGVNVE